MKLDNYNKNICMWYHSYITCSSTFQGAFNSKEPEKHPLYKCTSCDEYNHENDCDDYISLAKLIEKRNKKIKERSELEKKVLNNEI